MPLLGLVTATLERKTSGSDQHDLPSSRCHYWPSLQQHWSEGLLDLTSMTYLLVDATDGPVYTSLERRASDSDQHDLPSSRCHGWPWTGGHKELTSMTYLLVDATACPVCSSTGEEHICLDTVQVRSSLGPSHYKWFQSQSRHSILQLGRLSLVYAPYGFSWHISSLG